MPYNGTKKERNKKWREWYHKTDSKNRKRYVVQVAERRKRNANVINAYKSTLKCSNCPENHPACLEFHHDVEKGKKEFNISDALRLGYSLKRIFEEIKKCTILCANCHKKLHYNESHT